MYLKYVIQNNIRWLWY